MQYLCTEDVFVQNWVHIHYFGFLTHEPHGWFVILRFFGSRNPNLIVPRAWDGLEHRNLGGAPFHFQKDLLISLPYISDHPSLLCTLLYSIYCVLYTRITFPNIQKCKLYGILQIFTITLFSMYSEGLYYVLGVFWRLLRSRNSLATTLKFSEAQTCKLPCVLLLNCYIIMMINNETPQMKPRVVWGF